MESAMNISKGYFRVSEFYCIILLIYKSVRLG